MSDICKAELDLASIAFNSPWAIAEQIRLLRKYLVDDFNLNVFDNSTDPWAADQIWGVCLHADIRYVRSPYWGALRTGGAIGTPHERALRHACEDLLNRQAPWIGFLDHDVFPTCKTSLLDLATPGFFGLGQRSPKSQRRYVWPGLCVLSRAWLDGRRPDFNVRPSEGDTGARLADLFSDADWESLTLVKHAYHPIRPEDKGGTQSWAVEQIGDWWHCGNVSRWLAVPDPDGRERILRERLEAL